MISFIMTSVGDRYPQLELALKSYEQQTDQDFELIVVEHSDTNPATALNWAANQANGDILVITSPEVIHAYTNVKEIKKLPMGMFWVGQIIERDMENAPGIWTKQGLSVNGKRGIVAHCTEEDWEPWKYFIGAINAKDWRRAGGMNFDYTDGIAWEDRDFAMRVKQAGIDSSFNPEIVGVHLSHSRDYQRFPELRRRNRILFTNKWGRYEQE